MLVGGAAVSFQTVFKRYELKYMLTLEQKQRLLNVLSPYMKLDKYGRTTIRNLYYDTNDWLLIRRSIEKPSYKEKLRLRTYAKAESDAVAFVELKKKYKKVVYKRRISLPYNEAVDWLSGEKHTENFGQISKEVDYFLEYYKTLHPAMFISYEREAFYSKDGSDFRVTFDDNILCRTEDLSLMSEPYGERILPQGKVLMEIKCSKGIPLWMTDFLSKEKIFRTSFSKYGTAYVNMIYPTLYGGNVKCTKEEAYNA